MDLHHRQEPVILAICTESFFMTGVMLLLPMVIFRFNKKALQKIDRHFESRAFGKRPKGMPLAKSMFSKTSTKLTCLKQRSLPAGRDDSLESVSYTHLTLPTIYS